LLSWKLCYKVVIHLSSHTGNFFATLVTRVTRKGWGLAPPSLYSWRISTSRNAPLRQGERSGMRRSLCLPNDPRMFLPRVPLWRTVQNKNAVRLLSVSCLSLSSRCLGAFPQHTQLYNKGVT
jgi:hypothetical protein